MRAAHVQDGRQEERVVRAGGDVRVRGGGVARVEVVAGARHRRVLHPGAPDNQVLRFWGTFLGNIWGQAPRPRGWSPVSVLVLPRANTGVQSLITKLVA